MLSFRGVGVFDADAASLPLENVPLLLLRMNHRARCKGGECGCPSPSPTCRSRSRRTLGLSSSHSSSVSVALYRAAASAWWNAAGRLLRGAFSAPPAAGSSCGATFCATALCHGRAFPKKRYARPLYWRSRHALRYRDRLPAGRERADDKRVDVVVSMSANPL